ncbi:tonB-system energizer ExbB [Stenotrophomonas sp. 24(2023)]|uniref:tonB-system energizer ExbB n=1 Tax=Stenotrophomonas sp. 24(2023) TaxID=3068324 RepID=UPI0027DFE3BB|nr:tonB-system energizer ExbB [Stenotrophomonas sp. 24(2023)]WMJ70400.1 tonB-system energizer ExbB [Stenotrophomonas sp. 24(2023)]
MPVDVLPLATATPVLTPWGMYLAADAVVKAVMICLALASLATWTVLIAKTLELGRIGRGLRAARQVLVGSGTLAEAGHEAALQQGLAQQMLEAARTELRLSADAHGHDGTKERLASRLERIELANTRQLRNGTGVLASIGAVAPFVGLFGTVWGIMNSFVGIAASNTTNLAVVAPGIAEALLATAMGLVAAIPAVVIYNHFSRRLAVLRALSGDISASVQQIVSRDLDRGHALLRNAA